MIIMPLPVLNLLLLLVVCLPLTTHASFNYEIERRVVDAIDNFFGVPEDMVQILHHIRQNDGFPGGLAASDRNEFGSVAHALRQVSGVDMIYYGSEQGMFMGYHTQGWGTYREPGNNGYEPTNPEMQKYFGACINPTSGQAMNCVQEIHTEMVQCGVNSNDCTSLKVCGIPNTTTTSSTTDAVVGCQQGDPCPLETWCVSYDIVTVTRESMGYIPRTDHCHDVEGHFTETPGMVLQADGSLGDCTFADGQTPVNRAQVVGDYVFCGESTPCNNMLLGGFRSTNYDPRLRSWYKRTKRFQQPTWSLPYAFFTSGGLGITFSYPIYSHQQDQDDNTLAIFEGVMGADYTFADLNAFLNTSYGQTSELVAIYERQEPHYLVASSTSMKAATKVLTSDANTPCPTDATDSTSLCQVVRRSMNDFDTRHPLHSLVHAAYLSQEDSNYPSGLVSVKVSDDAGSQAYASQSSFYSAGSKNLEWVILVIAPVERSSSDAITKDNGLFGVVCTIAGLGFLLCMFMLASFLSQRKSRAVILADWRFTTAFLLGAALCNLASLTLLGDNTQGLCILRMWGIHLTFALALSPLFVKVYRVYKLVGSTARHPSIISTSVAIAMTLPIILIQVAILTIFTIVDPATPQEIVLLEDDAGAVQRVECQHETPAFYIVILTFEIGLVVVGCILAFAARKVDPGFGQSTELLFSMFNIAFIGIGIGVITLAMDVDRPGEIVLYTMGIFWSSVYSCAAFVVPRLLQASQDSQAQKQRQSQSQTTSMPPPKPSQPSQGVNNNPLSDKDITGWSAVGGGEDGGGEYQDRPLSGKDMTGWSAVQNDDDYAVGARSTTSQIE